MGFYFSFGVENRGYSKLSIENYEGKKDKTETCLSYKKLLKTLGKMNTNENILVVALTTYPLILYKLFGKDEIWINMGSSEKVKRRIGRFLDHIRRIIRNDKLKLAVVSIQKEKIQKEKESEDCVKIIEHTIAHLYGMDNYKFPC